MSTNLCSLMISEPPPSDSASLSLTFRQGLFGAIFNQPCPSEGHFSIVTTNTSATSMNIATYAGSNWSTVPRKYSRFLRPLQSSVADLSIAETEPDPMQFEQRQAPTRAYWRDYYLAQTHYGYDMENELFFAIVSLFAALKQVKAIYVNKYYQELHIHIYLEMPQYDGKLMDKLIKLEENIEMCFVATIIDFFYIPTSLNAPSTHLSHPGAQCIFKKQ